MYTSAVEILISTVYCLKVEGRKDIMKLEKLEMMQTQGKIIINEVETRN